ncbi:collectin-43-like isoform X2 [Eublepharis macularius]|uniref:Collectin-43-like isoform X2 n=1 Tax=Eublepharis macularius TaxID=481883 RepID=A0AA97L0T0_EUBMA|nr:collectin-43-like isoform X2 [Eublepharis macularius]
MTQPYIQTELLLLTIYLLVLGASLQKVTNSVATSYVLKGWVPNVPPARGSGEENGVQGPQDPVGAPSTRGPRRNDGSAPEKRLRRDTDEAELEYLRKEIRDVQTQLNVYKAAVNKTLQVLLIPDGVMVSGKIFKTDGSTGDYETAKILCSQMGATIASPRNAAENQAVRQIVEWQNRNAVLGINDIETEDSAGGDSGETWRH